ncbi:hypothetical protein FRC07_011691, partial [Ceratobasidium sp. 392]
MSVADELSSARQTVPDDVDSDDSASGIGLFIQRRPRSAGADVRSEEPVSPTSWRTGSGSSRHRSSHSIEDSASRVQIATARPFRIHTAKARSHSITAIKGLQLLSPESPPHP